MTYAVPSVEFFAALLVVAIAVAIAVLALRPYVPAWAVYALAVGLAFRQVLRVVEMGPSRENVVLAAGTILLAVFVWYQLRRRLRATRWEKGE